MRWYMAVALAAMLCFFAIAIYSPLHTHKNGDPKQCSLNNIEHQVADATAPVLTLPSPNGMVAMLPAEPAPELPLTVEETHSSRGPPSPFFL